MRDYVGKLILIAVVIAVGILYYGWSAGFFSNTTSTVSKSKFNPSSVKISFEHPQGMPLVFQYDPASGDYITYLKFESDKNITNAPFTAPGIPGFKAVIVNVTKADDKYVYTAKIIIPASEVKKAENNGLYITTTNGVAYYYPVQVANVPPSSSVQTGYGSLTSLAFAQYPLNVSVTSYTIPTVSGYAIPTSYYVPVLAYSPLSSLAGGIMFVEEPKMVSNVKTGEGVMRTIDELGMSQPNIETFGGLFMSLVSGQFSPFVNPQTSKNQVLNYLPPEMLVLNYFSLNGEFYSITSPMLIGNSAETVGTVNITLSNVSSDANIYKAIISYYLGETSNVTVSVNDSMLLKRFDVAVVRLPSGISVLSGGQLVKSFPKDGDNEAIEYALKLIKPGSTVFIAGLNVTLPNVTLPNDNNFYLIDLSFFSGKVSLEKGDGTTLIFRVSKAGELDINGGNGLTVLGIVTTFGNVVIGSVSGSSISLDTVENDITVSSTLKGSFVQIRMGAQKIVVNGDIINSTIESYGLHTEVDVAGNVVNSKVFTTSIITTGKIEGSSINAGTINATAIDTSRIYLVLNFFGEYESLKVTGDITSSNITTDGSPIDFSVGGSIINSQVSIVMRGVLGAGSSIQTFEAYKVIHLPSYPIATSPPTSNVSVSGDVVNSKLYLVVSSFNLGGKLDGVYGYINSKTLNFTNGLTIEGSTVTLNTTSTISAQSVTIEKSSAYIYSKLNASTIKIADATVVLNGFSTDYLNVTNSNVFFNNVPAPAYNALTGIARATLVKTHAVYITNSRLVGDPSNPSNAVISVQEATPDSEDIYIENSTMLGVEIDTPVDTSVVSSTLINSNILVSANIALTIEGSTIVNSTLSLSNPDLKPVANVSNSKLVVVKSQFPLNATNVVIYSDVLSGEIPNVPKGGVWENVTEYVPSNASFSNANYTPGTYLIPGVTSSTPAGSLSEAGKYTFVITGDTDYTGSSPMFPAVTNGSEVFVVITGQLKATSLFGDLDGVNVTVIIEPGATTNITAVVNGSVANSVVKVFDYSSKGYLKHVITGDGNVEGSKVYFTADKQSVKIGDIVNVGGNVKNSEVSVVSSVNTTIEGGIVTVPKTGNVTGVMLNVVQKDGGKMVIESYGGVLVGLNVKNVRFNILAYGSSNITLNGLTEYNYLSNATIYIWGDKGSYIEIGGQLGFYYDYKKPYLGTYNLKYYAKADKLVINGDFLDDVAENVTVYIVANNLTVYGDFYSTDKSRNVNTYIKANYTEADGTFFDSGFDTSNYTDTVTQIDSKEFIVYGDFLTGDYVYNTTVNVTSDKAEIYGDFIDGSTNGASLYDTTIKMTANNLTVYGDFVYLHEGNDATIDVTSNYSGIYGVVLYTDSNTVFSNLKFSFKTGALDPNAGTDLIDWLSLANSTVVINVTGGNSAVYDGYLIPGDLNNTKIYVNYSTNTTKSNDFDTTLSDSKLINSTIVFKVDAPNSDVYLNVGSNKVELTNSKVYFVVRSKSFTASGSDSYYGDNSEFYGVIEDTGKVIMSSILSPVNGLNVKFVFKNIGQLYLPDNFESNNSNITYVVENSNFEGAETSTSQIMNSNVLIDLSRNNTITFGYPLFGGNITGSDVKILLPADIEANVKSPLIQNSKIDTSSVCIELPNNTLLNSPVIDTNTLSNSTVCIHAEELTTNNTNVVSASNVSNSTVYVDTASSLSGQPSYVVLGACPLSGCPPASLPSGSVALPSAPVISATTKSVSISVSNASVSNESENNPLAGETIFILNISVGSGEFTVPTLMDNVKYLGISLKDIITTTSKNLTVDPSRTVATLNYTKELYPVPNVGEWVANVSSTGYLTSISLTFSGAVDRFEPPIKPFALVPAVVQYKDVNAVAKFDSFSDVKAFMENSMSGEVLSSYTSNYYLIIPIYTTGYDYSSYSSNFGGGSKFSTLGVREVNPGIFG